MNAWDLDLFWHINRDWTHPVLDWLMPTLSAIDVWLPFLVLLLTFIAWRGGRRERLMLLALALALGLSDGVVGNGLKKTFDRVRPRDQMSGVMMRDLAKVKPRVLALFKAPEIKISKVKKVPETGNSLPSNHTINLFAAATVIGLFFRRWALPMYLLAAAVAYSRVYVGAHWPSDIPPSAALGLSIGWLVVALLQKLFRQSASEA
ncbi:MAG: phosphatase PAP2 family protein [Verrucomicrobiaceae bacterium]|nr:phosphatase PAP2 family protein [Verrucomicrobiaceae bacterium]